MCIEGAVQLKETSDVKQWVPECFEKYVFKVLKEKKKKNKRIIKKSSTSSKTIFKKWGIIKTFPEKWTLIICY